MISFALHCALYRWDSDKGQPIPDLAESVERVGDGPRYRVRLHPNAKFHNGRPVTADDVIWSFNRAIDPAQGLAGARYVRSIVGADAVQSGTAKTLSGLKKIDDHTLEFELTENIDPGYLFFWPATAILPSDEIAARGDRFGSEPVGCGPFKFTEMVSGSRVVLDRFDDYFHEGRPYLDRVTYAIMGEAAARDIAFRSGQIDINTVSPAQIAAYRNDPSLSANLLDAVVDYTRHMGFNQRFEPFKDVRVRQAINYAIDSQLIIDRYLNGQAKNANGWVPATNPVFEPDFDPFPYDPDKARALMKEAGYENGFELKILTNNNQEYGVGIVEVIRPFLKAINIEVKPIIVENSVAVEVMFGTGDFDAYQWAYSSGPDPYVALKRFLSSTDRPGGNAVGYANPEFDALMKKVDETSGEERIAALRTANRFLAEDAPGWFFNYSVNTLAYKPYVHGLQKNSVHITYQYPDLIWLDDTAPQR